MYMCMYTCEYRSKTCVDEYAYYLHVHVLRTDPIHYVPVHVHVLIKLVYNNPSINEEQPYAASETMFPIASGMPFKWANRLEK